MDGIRGEVSNKIRSAIKAKLMELGAYVDDELPDYIMVMVANKRSRQQMEDDLQLFLGDNTSTFTAWLHTVLSKLQQVTVNNAELKKNVDKKRPSEDHKKEKKKKLKKEKDKPEKTLDQMKPIEKTPEEQTQKINQPTFSVRGHQIKTEPVDLIADEDDLLGDSQTQNKSQPKVGALLKKLNESRMNEDDDDDDFINLKADVEADMWGEAEESSMSAAKNSSVVQQHAALAVAQNSSETQMLKTHFEKSNQSKSATPKTTNIVSSGEKSSASDSPVKHSEPTPAPTIIRISETIRQEKETLKPPTQQAKDSQGLAKRVFQSHIVSIRSGQDKSNKSQSRTSQSHASDTHSRRIEYRSNRKHEHEDLRQSLRRERQRERDYGREREREERRSREHHPSQKPQTAIPSIVRASLSHEDGPDPSLMSVVRVKPRPQIPAALQANRSLILKAVAEAQKSVSKVVIRPELTQTNVLPKPKQSMKAAKVFKDQPNVKTKTSPKKDHSKLKQGSRLPSREKLKKMSFTVLGEKSVLRKISPDSDVDDGSDDGSIILDPSLNILIQVPASPAADESLEPPDPVQTEKVRRWIKDVEEATLSQKIVAPEAADFETDVGIDADAFAGQGTRSKQDSDDDAEEFDDGMEADTNSFKTSDIHSVVISEDQPCRKQSGTQFVVTLDGLDPRLLRSFALEGDGPTDGTQEQHCHKTPSEAKPDQEDDSLIRDELAKEELLRQELLKQQAAVREKKMFRRPTIAVTPVPAHSNSQVKRPASPSSSLEARPQKALAKGLSIERCKFWPSCKKLDKCEFHHPSVPCKLFPNCKFVDRCLYIHPNCRFNSSCTRPDCPYTHTSPRPVPITPSSGTNHGGGHVIKQACKYYPNCSNINCPYIHPTVCKFGTHCTTPKCQFIHSDKTIVTKHKWIRH